MELNAISQKSQPSPPKTESTVVPDDSQVESASSASSSHTSPDYTVAISEEAKLSLEQDQKEQAALKEEAAREAREIEKTAEHHLEEENAILSQIE